MTGFPQEKIHEATRALRAVAHELRLAVLCHLSERPMTVSELQAATGAVQSNLSQHLAKMRLMGLLTCERHSQQVTYRLADPAFARLTETLKSIYCSPTGAACPGEDPPSKRSTL